jgi:hypothetical protein
MPGPMISNRITYRESYDTEIFGRDNNWSFGAEVWFGIPKINVKNGWNWFENWFPGRDHGNLAPSSTKYLAMSHRGVENGKRIYSLCDIFFYCFSVLLHFIILFFIFLVRSREGFGIWKRSWRLWKKSHNIFFFVFFFSN